MTQANDNKIAFNAAMGRYQQEVVRWNRQINLVSRKGTLGRVAELIGQCRDAWWELAAAEMGDWDEADPVWYFDLGSGGGLPGFVWHQLMSTRFTSLSTWLVEPRVKRAWFLERLNQITPDRPLLVWGARWGETPSVDVGGPAVNVLISLKALRLPDPVVLAGLNCALGGEALTPAGKLTIARFYPPKQRHSRELVSELGFADQPLMVGDYIYHPTEQRVLTPKKSQPFGAALVLSSYRISS